MSQQSGTALKSALDIANQKAEAALSIPVLPLELSWADTYKPVMEIANLPLTQATKDKADAYFFGLLFRLVNQMGYEEKSAEAEVIDGITQCARISYPGVGRCILTLFVEEEAKVRRTKRGIQNPLRNGNVFQTPRPRPRKGNAPQEFNAKPAVRPIVFEDI